MSMSAFAASNSANVSLPHAISVNGKQLPKGDYKVKWEGSGSDVQVSFLQGKNVIATASGKVTPRQSKANYTSFQTTDDGALTAVTIDGHRDSIVLDQAQATATGK